MVFKPSLAQGWSLLGNPLNRPLYLAETFGSLESPVDNITTAIVSVWKWSNGSGQWGFYSPQLTAEGNMAYAASKGMYVINAINPGEGFWVSSRWGIDLPEQVGEEHSNFYANFAALAGGWQLLGLPRPATGREFNQQVNPVPVVNGVIPTTNFVSWWAWEQNAKKWTFYAPSIDAVGNDQVSYDFTDKKGYFNGTYWTVQSGSGIWVNKFAPVPTVCTTCKG